MNYEAGEKKEAKNNIPAMKQKLAEMQSTKLNWVERLDLVNGPAPLAPELAYKEELHRSGKMKVPEWVDLVNTNNRFVLKLFLHLLSSLSRAQVIELLFTGRSLPPMMRIGSTSAQLPWPATCTSGLASFYTFCAPYLWCAHIYLENNVTLNHLRSEKKLLCKSTSKQGEDEFRLTFL